MKTPEKSLAERLLKISAVKLQPESPFIWVTGWNAPIYIDNRRALSYPDVRNYIKIELCRKIVENFPDATAIAGVATGAIAIAAICADDLGLPFVYVRSTPKDHGLENMIEGNLRPGSKVVVVEDIISTGSASLNVVDTVRSVACDVVGMVSIVNFEFPMAVKNFREKNVKLVSLLNYTTMVEVASEHHYVEPADVDTLREWHRDPAGWTPRRHE